jgi:hypothetical protein
MAVSVHRLASAAGSDRIVTVWLPESTRPLPLIVFAHANGLQSTAGYAALLDHLASRGSAVVHVPYPTERDDHRVRTEAMWAGVASAVARFESRIDLRRIGFVGHSYGAGALPYLARRSLVDQGWGGDGAFVFAAAPWFTVRAEGVFEALPPHLQVVVVTFDADEINDPRIAQDDFARWPVTGKAFWRMRSVERAGCSLPATHAVPQTAGLGGQDDALDEGLRWLLDALVASAFDADRAGRAIALEGSEPWLLGHVGGEPVLPLTRVEQPEQPVSQRPYLFRFADRKRWLAYGGE